MNINWKVRLKNPVFWVQVIASVLMTAFTYNSLSPQDITTWEGLLSLMKGIGTNPYLLGLCFVNLWSAVNDPTTSGVRDSARALQYERPKEREE